MSRRDQIVMSEDELRAFLDEVRVVTCASVGPSGRPHLMPLWFVRDDLDLLCWTFAKSQKAVNLRRDPRATLSLELGDTYDQLRGAMIEADVTIVDDPRPWPRSGWPWRSATPPASSHPRRRQRSCTR